MILASKKFAEDSKNSWVGMFVIVYARQQFA